MPTTYYELDLLICYEILFCFQFQLCVLISFMNERIGFVEIESTDICVYCQKKCQDL